MAFDATTFEIGKNRIEALSDGIFAIVMTLLILEIHVPTQRTLRSRQRSSPYGRSS